MPLNPNSPLFQGLTKVFDTILITLLWVLFTLPILTGGAAASAMYASMLAQAEQRGGGVIRRFLESLRENLRVSTCIWLPFLGLGALLAADCAICWFAAPQGLFWQILRGLTLCAAAVYLCLPPYLFAGAGRFVVTARQAWRNALLLALQHPGKTLCMLLLGAAMAVCWVLLLFFALPVTALVFYLQAKLLSSIFATHIPREELPAEGV